MKKIYTFNIFVTLILHIVIPICIYLIFGFEYEYAPVKEQYVYMAAIILAGVLLVSAILIFVFVLYGMIFLVQKFLEKVDPSIEEIDMSRVIPYLVISAVIIAIKYFTSK